MICSLLQLGAPGRTGIPPTLLFPEPFADCGDEFCRRGHGDGGLLLTLRRLSVGIHYITISWKHCKEQGRSCRWSSLSEVGCRTCEIMVSGHRLRPCKLWWICILLLLGLLFCCCSLIPGVYASSSSSSSRSEGWRARRKLAKIHRHLSKITKPAVKSIQVFV